MTRVEIGQVIFSYEQGKHRRMFRTFEGHFRNKYWKQFEWLKANCNSGYRFMEQIVEAEEERNTSSVRYSPDAKIFRCTGYIEFDNETDAVFFKLTFR